MGGGPHLTPEKRFWKYVEKTDGCWFWVGYRDPDGYGRFTVNHRFIRANRYSLELHKGPIPEGLFACHHCDTPACVNPEHLYAGTAKENALDMAKRGRRATPTAKITKETADQIRAEYALGDTSYSILSEKYGLVKSSIGDIIQRKSWK